MRIHALEASTEFRIHDFRNMTSTDGYGSSGIFWDIHRIVCLHLSKISEPLNDQIKHHSIIQKY